MHNNFTKQSRRKPLSLGTLGTFAEFIGARKAFGAMTRLAL